MQMLTKNIAEMTARVDAHLAADLLVQGTYYDATSGRGCFIGCLAKGNRPQLIADQFGFPVLLARVLESVFEALPLDEAKQFFADIPRAVKDGADLSKVVWAFLASELRSLLGADDKSTSAVNAVICGMDLLAAGKAWPAAAAARAAAGRAARATRAAAVPAPAYNAAAIAAAAAGGAVVYTANADAKACISGSDAAYANAAAAYATATYATAAATAAAAYDAAARIRQRDTLLTLMREAA